MRGIASLLVVLFHLRFAVNRTAEGWLWTPLDWIAGNGAFGVDLFFTVSGFVIAMSVQHGAHTPSYLGRFIARRSIRLDPPYWGAIVLEITLLSLTTSLLPSLAHPMPTAAAVGAHLLYAQNLLGYGNIVESFWTLCYEIQFYVGYVLLLLFWRGWTKAGQQRCGSLLPVAVLGFLFGASLWTRFVDTSLLATGIALNRWFQFFLGVLTFWALRSELCRRLLIAASAILAAIVLMRHESILQLLPLPVVLGLYLSIKYPPRVRWLTWSPIVWLGTFSYSIYLYHASVGWRAISLAQKLLPGPWSPPVALSIFTLAIAGSIAFAYAMHLILEVPFMRLARHVSLPSQPVSLRA